MKERSKSWLYLGEELPQQGDVRRSKGGMSLAEPSRQGGVGRGRETQGEGGGDGAAEEGRDWREQGLWASSRQKRKSSSGLVVEEG